MIKAVDFFNPAVQHCKSGNGVMPNNVQRMINGGHQNVASTSGWCLSSVLGLVMVFRK